MGTDVNSGNVHDVTCPHCKKTFTAPLLAGRRARGFKCPHCRLFVPLERASDAPRNSVRAR
jgi:tRNA(Ile2) C34 agmatinyltransferase TiaS